MLVQTNKRPSKDSILPSPFVFERFLSTMRAIQGTLIVASSVQIILGYSQLWAICSRFFSPLGMVPVIALGGFGLFDKGFPVAGQCVKIGVPMFILFVIFSQSVFFYNVEDYRDVFKKFPVQATTGDGTICSDYVNHGYLDLCTPPNGQ